MVRYLCISEKPTAAKRIAAALDETGKARKIPTPRTFASVPVYECKNNGDIIYVIPALGHLYSTVEDSIKGWHYPTFNYKWVPTYLAQQKNNTRPFILAFKNFSEKVDEIIIATDYDLEGEVIGASIAKFACKKELNSVRRMKFSTLTKKEILESYKNMHPSIDLNLAQAGFTRHEIDWLYGINLTRALTLAIKHATGRYKLISTGRVQGPTLKFVADREREIQTFVPIPRWAIEATIILDGEEIALEYQEKFIPTLAEAEQIVRETTDTEGIVSKITERQFSQKPPLPFNLGTLQSEAYRYFGYSPSRTLKIAERLYLNALISYPRTGSQQFSETINHKQILKELTKSELYRDRAEKLLQKTTLKPTKGKKKDPAHPPIHPTGKKAPAALRTEDKNIYRLITCRYLALFGEPAVKKSLRLDINFNGYIFFLRGMKVLKKGWLELYAPFGKVEEIELPELKKGDTVKMLKVRKKQSYTQPPARYNPNSLLKKMEEEELGTKATRANIIDILYSRGYIEDESIYATDLGFAVIDTLEKNSPEIIETELTRHLERNMEKIRSGEKTRVEVLMEAIRELKNILENFHKKEEIIGVTLQEQVQNLKQRQRILGPCPICKQGELIITRSRTTQKRFVGCTGYYKKLCDWSAPIPQQGYATPAKKNCPHCGFPMLTIRKRGKRPYTICPNWLKCPGTPQEVLDNYQNQKAEALEAIGEDEEDEL
ncbi:MAG: DNA topoisomerase I [Candidatus Heimdallarchaeota archaeon]|nr:MAG: DNA topoisomerase I [Candidatus Gerdarchaeota archaeon]RLI71623.1 MAG: DNA topoisomerase I [Candidatus Gerdarchaeota archaeon]RLI74473.1 MAG: DNA topoisomerase I [Candidatus Heimdallarchaeota archaeon]